MSQIDNVSVLKQANVYFDGKCVSHTLLFPDGSRKTLGVLLPSSLVFNTAAPEVMEITGGVCKVRLAGQTDWSTYAAGDSFNVPGNSSFEIETTDLVNYICHFG